MLAETTDYQVGFALTCVVCKHVGEATDEWGEDWTDDDEGNMYCADHKTANPTSDNYQG